VFQEADQTQKVVPIHTTMSASTKTLIKQAKTEREAGNDAFADYVLALRKASAHKTAGFKAERPFYAKEFGIGDRALSDWTHAGRVRAKLTSIGVNLTKEGNAGVTAYLGVQPTKAEVVKTFLDEGDNLKDSLLQSAGYNLAAFNQPEKAFDALLDENLPPAFEALQLSLLTLAFATEVKILKEGQQALWEAYEALGMILQATDRNIPVEELILKEPTQ